MAAIDKLYITWVTYCKFKEWCEKQPPLYDKYGKKTYLKDWLWDYNEKNFINKNGEYSVLPVMSNPYYIDAYIIRNCPIEEIQEELMLNYGYWSQKMIREYYENIKNWQGESKYPYWAKLEDFIFNPDGTITLKGLEKSSYEMIKDNELYTLPYRENVEYGKHFKMTSSPNGKKNSVPYNRPSEGVWHITVENANNSYDVMDYNKSTRTWDFCDEFVITQWSSSIAYSKTIKAVKRKIRKWNLPIDTKVIVFGYFINEKYEFIIKK